METAQQFLTEHCTTVAEAVAMGSGTNNEIRAKIRRNELRVIRIYGRILINKNDLLRLRGSL